MKKTKIINKWYFRPFICSLIVFLLICGLSLVVNANTLEGYEKGYREISYFNPDYIEFGYDNDNVAICTGIDTNSALDEWNDYYLLGDKEETPSVEVDEFVGTWVLNERFYDDEYIDFGYFENIGIYYYTYQSYETESSWAYLDSNVLSISSNIVVSVNYYYTNSNGILVDIGAYVSSVGNGSSNRIVLKDSGEGIHYRTLTVQENYKCTDVFKNWIMANATKQEASSVSEYATTSTSSNNFQIQRQNTKYLNSSATAYRVESIYNTTNTIKSIDIYFDDIYVTKETWSNLSQLVPCFKYYNMSTEQYVDAYVDYSFDIEFYTALKETSDQVNKFNSYSYSSTYLGNKLYYLPQYVSVSSYLNEKGISSDDLQPNQIFRLRNVKISYSVPSEMQIEHEYSFETDEYYANNYRDLRSNYYTYSTYSGLVSSLLLGVNNFLSFELVPGLSLFSILMMALVIPLLIWLLKVFLGG